MSSRDSLSSEPHGVDCGDVGRPRRSPRLVVYHNVIAPYKVPFFRGLAQAFEGEIVLFTSSGDRQRRRSWGEQEITEPNLEIRRLDTINSPFLGVWYHPGLFRQLLGEEFDVLLTGDYVFGSTLLTLLAARLKRKPAVLYTVATRSIGLRDDHPLRVVPAANALYGLIRLRPIVEWSLRSYDRLVTPSEASVEHLVSLGVDADRIEKVANPVDLDRFSPGRTEQGRGVAEDLGVALPDADVVVGFVGRLVREKGVDLLVEAFGQLDRGTQERTALLLVGDGPLRGELQESVSRLGLAERVVFAGQVGHETVASLHSAIDIFVLPSIPQEHNVEQFCNALQEAMAAGEPAVVFDIDAGFREYVRHGENALLADDVTVPGLAGPLTRLVEDGELRRRLGRGARRTAERLFSPREVGAAYARVLTEVADRR